MASNIVFSTLMVLLSKSDQDMEDLWNTAGAVNDPTGNKHALDLQDVIYDGNFRSALIDEWGNQSFDSVSVYGTNIFGDILWETEFNVTGTSSLLSSWLVGDNIIYSTALLPESQETIYGDQNYRLRIEPPGSTNTSWFAVTESDLSYGPLPHVLVPRSPYRPFSNPVYVDGMLGCWYLADLINVVYMYQDFLKMKPASCIAECRNNFTIAMLVGMNKCYCADIDTTNPPTDDFSKCYMNCPFHNELCGGFGSTAGSPYRVQGNSLPGDINITLLYQGAYINNSATIQVDVSEIAAGSTVDPAFISEISVLSGSPGANYTVQYAEDPCLNASGNIKDLSINGTSPTVFQTNGVSADVDILKVRCIYIILSEVLYNVTVELWGPNVTSEHVEVPALVIRGKTEVPVTTSSTTTSSPTPTSTTTSTTASSTTTSTTDSTTTASTSEPSTTTSSSTSTSSAITTSATSSGTSVTTSTEHTPESTCFCPCNITQLNLTDEQLQAKIIEIQCHLAVNVSKLSSTIRKLTSAGDTRVSAVSIGYVGIGILATILTTIVLIDSAMLLREMRNLFHNVKTGFCTRDE